MPRTAPLFGFQRARYTYLSRKSIGFMPPGHAGMVLPGSMDGGRLKCYSSLLMHPFTLHPGRYSRLVP